MAQPRDNFKAGLFVIVGVALALGVVFTLSDFSSYFQSRQTLKVAFPLDEGLHGLKVGSIVSLGDDPVGHVTAIEDVTQISPGGDQRVTGMLALCEVPSRVHLYQDAMINVAQPLLGADTRLNIRSVGAARPYDPAAPAPGDRIGVQPVASLGDAMQSIGVLAGQLRHDLPELTARARQLLIQVQPILERFQAALDDLKHATADARAVIADTRARSPQWLDHIDHVTASADQSVATLHSLIKDKAPAIRQSIDNLQQITADVRQKTLVQVNEALDHANAALVDLRETARQVRGLITGQRPILERAIANAELTTDELKLASIEIRRSPWRLLYHPSKKQLNSDNLYDAARSFALAAGSLDSASKSLRAVIADQPQDRKQIDKMEAYLEANFVHFEQAEDDFWKALKDQSKP